MPAGLSAAGLASVALAGLLPHAPGYLVTILVLIALPMSWPLVPALVTGLALAGATLMALQAREQPVESVASVGIAAVFFFTVGACASPRPR